MSRIKQCFEQLDAAHKSALVTFITAGDPNPEITVSLMRAMVEAGANILELGIPFSDPMADGPVIQKANERALAHNVALRDVIGMVRQFRQSDQQTPVVLMGYLNPIETLGYDSFAELAAEAGVDGVITVDIPPEEAEDYLRALRGRGIDPVFLLAPTSDSERIARICEAAGGFVYYVSVKGTTGSATFAIGEVASKVFEIRKATRLPVGVGFGIKDAESAQAVAQVADAVIVGSVLVKQIEALADEPESIAPALALTISQMREAMDLI
ncbi:MAG: tryptophan synthase subunit alpha [Gammaproteobacteria bacterium]|nr:tryptophan synthase subunit alpha [Gammaproteobacteria bacterium]